MSRLRIFTKRETYFHIFIMCVSVGEYLRARVHVCVCMCEKSIKACMRVLCVCILYAVVCLSVCMCLRVFVCVCVIISRQNGYPREKAQSTRAEPQTIVSRKEYK